MPIAILLLSVLASCTSATATATAAAPRPEPVRTDPGALAALARDTAIDLGLAVPAMRDQLELVFEPRAPAPSDLTIIRVTNPDRHLTVRIVFTDDAAGVRPIAAWPL
jgi:hypothetical protein